MSDAQDGSNSNGNWRWFKALLGLLVVALAVTATVALSSRLSDEARAVLAGAICLSGALITVGLLLIFVRQYHEQK